MSGNAGSEQLRARWTTAIHVLLATGSALAAAESVGVHPDTVGRWKRDPAFRAMYDEELASFVETHRRELHALVARATDTLWAAMGEDQAMRDRVAAAKVVFASAASVALPMPTVRPKPLPGNVADLKARARDLKAGGA